MIVDINKQVSAGGLKDVLEYHDKKIEKGAGTIFENGVDFCSKNEHNVNSLLDSFENFMRDTSPKSSTQRYHHLAVNFNTRDNISEQAKTSILYQWMRGMNYDQTKYIIYRHSDKEHDHFHIVCSSTTIDGKKIDSHNDYVRSAELSRKIEKENGLEVLATVGNGQNFDRFEKYRYAIALAKLTPEEFSQKAFDAIRDSDYKKLSNDQVIGRYKKINQHDYFHSTVLEYLTKKGYLKESVKAKIYKAVSTALPRVNSINGLIVEVQKSGIYARRVLRKGKAIIQFGDPELNIYAAGEKVNKNFSLEGLEKTIQQNRIKQNAPRKSRGDDFEMGM